MTLEVYFQCLKTKEKTEKITEKATTAVETGRENPAPAAGAGEGAIS